MRKLIIAVIVVLIAGFAAAAWLATPQAPVAATAALSDPDFSTDATVEDRLLSLEAAIDAERQARQLLEEEILVLYETLDALGGGAGGSAVGSVLAEVREVPAAARSEFRDSRRNNTDRRLQQMTDAGFAPSRAEWILERESELRMEAMQTRYEAARSGEPIDPREFVLGPDSQLRAEIGDAEYEMFLEAQGRPTAVGVTRVMGSSPALLAGLQPGDQITHYDGERVYSTIELTRQTMLGTPGENVAVDIVRNGAPMQVIMPRGPLGIMTGRRR